MLTQAMPHVYAVADIGWGTAQGSKRAYLSALLIVMFLLSLASGAGPRSCLMLPRKGSRSVRGIRNTILAGGSRRVLSLDSLPGTDWFPYPIPVGPCRSNDTLGRLFPGYRRPGKRRASALHADARTRTDVGEDRKWWVSRTQTSECRLPEKRDATRRTRLLQTGFRSTARMSQTSRKCLVALPHCTCLCLDVRTATRFFSPCGGIHSRTATWGGCIARLSDRP